MVRTQLLAQASDSSFEQFSGNPIVLVLGLLWIGFILYCGVRTALNGRWMELVVGFFCCTLLWIYGAFAGPKDLSAQAARQQRKALRRMRAGKPPKPSGAPPPGQRRPDGRCPQCGARDQTGTPRCRTCGYFFGGP
jgi:hypothetical protein